MYGEPPADLEHWQDREPAASVSGPVRRARAPDEPVPRRVRCARWNPSTSPPPSRGHDARSDAHARPAARRPRRRPRRRLLRPARRSPAQRPASPARRPRSSRRRRRRSPPSGRRPPVRRHRGPGPGPDRPGGLLDGRAARRDDAVHPRVTFEVGWGDCQAGCIDRHTWTWDGGADGSTVLWSARRARRWRRSMTRRPRAARRRGRRRRARDRRAHVPGRSVRATRPAPRAWWRAPCSSSGRRRQRGRALHDRRVSGLFRIALAAGEYTLEAAPVEGFMSGPPPASFTVAEGADDVAGPRLRHRDPLTTSAVVRWSRGAGHHQVSSSAGRRCRRSSRQGHRPARSSGR